MQEIGRLLWRDILSSDHKLACDDRRRGLKVFFPMGLLIRQVYILDVAGRTIQCVDVVCYSYNYRKTYADVQHRAVIIHQPRAMRKRIIYTYIYVVCE